MAKEANFGFLAIFSGVSHASQSYSQVFRPCFSAVFPGLVFPDMSPGGWPCSRGWQEAQPCTERLLMNCAPCITRLFSGHLACPVPEKGASGTEYLLRTGKACFLHRMPLKMRRVPEEAFLSTARIFRTVGGPLRYRMPTTSIHSLPATTALPANKKTPPTQNTPSIHSHLPGQHKKKKSRLNVTSIGTSEKRQLPTRPPGGAVPSALVSLTSLFGMGRGGSSPL